MHARIPVFVCVGKGGRMLSLSTIVLNSRDWSEIARYYTRQMLTASRGEPENACT